MSEFAEHNRRAWDEVHRRRADVLAGTLGLSKVERKRLPELAGKRVLHLQCGIGEATAGLAGLAAEVVGVDISEEALAIARERSPEIAWVRADVHALPPELRRGEFDLVYTGGGVLCWIDDLKPWAAGIAAALAPGGTLFLFDGHPVAACVGSDGRWEYDYFDDSVVVDRGWAHFELPGEPAKEDKHERLWRLGQVVNAVVDAGLRIVSLEELPNAGSFRGHDARIPGEFLLVAVKG